jgi:quinol monooxygenase YgiN
MSLPVTVLVTYKPKPGKEQELEELVRRHGPMMRATGLLGPDGVRSWRATSKRGHGEGVYFVELMQWRDGEASGIAHQTPEVMSVWEPMEALLEELIIAPLEALGEALPGT